MTSKRKIRANQENAKKSTGPTSPEGKDTASGNSYKHGIWAKELVILKEESADYEKLVSDLEAALEPTGPILQYYFDEIILCMWRLKRLVRFENAQFAIVVDPQTSEVQFDAFAADALAPKTARGLSEQLRILKDLYQRALGNPVSLVDSEKDLVKEFFGEAFLAALETWLSSPSENYTELMRKIMENKSRRYGLPDLQLKPPDANPRESAATTLENSELNRIRVEVKRAVLLEIIGARIQKLEALVSRAKNTLATPDTLELRADLQLRYSAALKRDLRKALDTYYHHQELLARKAAKKAAKKRAKK